MDVRGFAAQLWRSSCLCGAGPSVHSVIVLCAVLMAVLAFASYRGVVCECSWGVSCALCQLGALFQLESLAVLYVHSAGSWVGYGYGLKLLSDKPLMALALPCVYHTGVYRL